MTNQMYPSIPDEVIQHYTLGIRKFDNKLLIAVYGLGLPTFAYVLPYNSQTSTLEIIQEVLFSHIVELCRDQNFSIPLAGFIVSSLVEICSKFDVDSDFNK